MAVPDDVLVKRQVLAEPDGALSERTWAALADGTPLVTAAPSGQGWLILFHVTADTSWSNLPLSGTFVEMLRRIVAFSTAAQAGTADAARPAPRETIAPWRLLDGFGRLGNPGPQARPIPANAAAVVPGPQHPPGLYGSDAGFVSLNLLGSDAVLRRFEPTHGARCADVAPYPTEAPTDLRPWLLALALALFLLDALAVLWLNGGSRRSRRRRAAGTAAVLVVAAIAASVSPARDAECPCR